MRIVFMGTPEIAVPTLSEILAAGHEVVAVYCQPPRPAGRGMDVRKSPVQVHAEASGIPVLTPRSLKGEAEQAVFRTHAADVAVVIAYGLLLPKPILDAPRDGCLNMHGSALPRWRGAAPLQRAIMAGDTETAAMIMRMDEGLDTGPVCLAERIPIGPEMTAGELHDRMMLVGAGLMVRALAALERGSLRCTPQTAEGVTYAAKIDKAETRLDLARPATEVHNHIRGLSPFPGAWLEAGPEGRRERIKVLRAALAEGHGEPGAVLEPDGPVVACGHGAIRLVEVQRAGRKPVTGPELMRGFELGRLSPMSPPCA
ncbi:MAG: methionyl-tRNA formyltransferase [Hyphomicrobiaceae bacterium]